MKAYQLIDSLPELPYIILALAYIALYPLERSLHVLATAFIFLLTGLVIGLALKRMIRSERPKKYKGIPIAEYDIPSLHTLLSIGAIAFVYQIERQYTIIFIPLGLIYMVSRVGLGVHTKSAVIFGAAIGMLLGSFFGVAIDGIDYKGLEGLFTILFFLTPVTATFFRKKFIKESSFPRPRTNG